MDAPERMSERIRSAYAAYSEQRLDDLAALFSDDVDYPDGATRMHGIAAVRAYWADQWTRTATVDRPSAIAELAEDVYAVTIEQVVRDRSGAELSRGRFAHILHVEHDRFRRLDILPI